MDGAYDEVKTDAEPSARRPMDDDTLRSILRSEIDEAISFSEELSFERAKATDYYHGRPFGDEEEGRSQVVSRDVRDTVMAIMPNLMRIFFGAEKVAEFVPRGPEDVEMAEQATDVINYIFRIENPGFLILYSVFKDAMIRKTGIIKWGWEERVEVTGDTYTGLDEDGVMLLADQAAEYAEEVDFEVEPEEGKPTFTIHLRRKKKCGRVRIWAIPPEEFLIDRDARSIDDATLVAHRSVRTVGELVSLGYDYDLVLENAGIDELEYNPERLARQPLSHFQRDVAVLDDASKPVLYCEAYLRVDCDGDGIAELRKICAIGQNYTIVHNSIVQDRPFADFCPDPEPHAFFGLSVADIVADLQRVKSAVMRQMLDSLASSIHPRTAVVEGQVNIEDAMNTEVGAIIRTSAPGMVQPFVLPFVGKEAFPLLDYLDQIKQDRTGISKAAAGLDADALQSTTRAAVAATVSAAHAHIELLARIFAETGLKRLMRGILRLLCQHQDQPRVIRLRNKWVRFNPADWDADMDVEVNVAIGSSAIEERRAALEAIAQRQELILQQFGPQNPLVTVAQYRNTLAKIIELSGFRDPSAFFNEVPPNWQPPPPQPPPEQQAAQMLAQVQVEQIKADIAKKQAELRLREQELLLQDDRERDKLEAEIALRARELEMKYQQAVDIAQIRAGIERDRTAQQMRLKAMQMSQPEPQQGG